MIKKLTLQTKHISYIGTILVIIENSVLQQLTHGTRGRFD